MPTSLFPNPFIAGDVGLPDNSGNEINTDLGAVGIGDGKNECPFNHVRVFAALERAVEPECLHFTDKFRP